MIARLRAGVAVLAVAVMTASCRGDTVMTPAPADGAAASLVLSAESAALGDTIAVRVRVTSRGPVPVAALQGTLQWPAGQWRYVGQAASKHLVMVNDQSQSDGSLRFSAVQSGGLPTETADFRFVAERGGRLVASVLFEEVVQADGAQVDGALLVQEASRVEAVTSPAAVRRMTADDWIRQLEPGYDRRAGVVRRPGSGAIYGDANLSGTVTSGDLVVIANVSVGNLELLTSLNRDLAIAGNVAPANLPGLGEPSDALPPGQAADGSRTISSADQLVIANFTVGVSVAIVGQPIPGRGGPATGTLPRVILDFDTLRSDRIFRRDTVYEVRGTYVVGDVPPRPTSQPNVTLTIDAGTRVEFDPSTNGRLVIAAGANLIAVGTRLQPIVFTCAAATPFPGCWGGVHIHGFALLNNSEQIGSPLKTGRGGTGTYGGFLNADSSGVLRYVRIEYAGRPTATQDTLGALQLLGVGSATQFDYLQVHRALGDGLFVSGGRPALRYLFLSDNRGTALRWDDGWTGKVQFAVVQQGAESGDAFRGSNAANDPRTGPRSAPQLSHVTVVGPPTPAPESRVIRLTQGSGGLFLNLIALRAAAVGFDLESDASCEFLAAHPDSLGLAASVFFANGANFASDAADCLDESAYALAPERRNRVGDPQLNGPFVTQSPDLRPLFGSLPTGGDSLPPADDFFDRTARFIGAVPPAAIQRNGIPWYAGWTVGF